MTWLSMFLQTVGIGSIWMFEEVSMMIFGLVVFIAGFATFVLDIANYEEEPE